MFKKIKLLVFTIIILSFISCGGGSSKEARELFSKILQFIGIPHSIVAIICQDKNSDGICGNGDLFAKITINKGDSMDDILYKISLTDDGKYFLETYNATLPILVELQDEAKVNYDEGKFTLLFNGFKRNKDDNETKEISILESMIDANAISKAEADKFRTLDNAEAQDKFYAILLNDLETNINTLRAKGLDSKTAVKATIKEMADETKANKDKAGSINNCGNDQTCVDKELKKVSDELVIDENESKEIVSQNTTPTATPTTSTGSTSIVKKTGQTEIYYSKDDGDYQKGVEPNYSRSGEIVTEHVTRLKWQDNEDAKTVQKSWDEAKNYCNNLTLGGKSDWRLPTVMELNGIVDYGKYEPSINSIFVNTNSNFYWSSTSSSKSSKVAWIVNFDMGKVYDEDKIDNRYVRCVGVGE